ncbi:MAG TPA: outer membrane beta-barrel protein [Gemmatimonadaceae bacterium]|nr:outer membrane beta-barrel protein [Gemmatimonadaceae bacterium]
MTTSFAIRLALPLALLVPLGSLAAQQDQHLVRIGFAGGVVVPTADARNALKQGVQGQGFLLFNLGGFPLRLNLGYQHFNLADALKSAQSGGGTTDGSSNILGGVAGTQINLLPGPVRPYILAGVGGFNVTNMLTAANGQSTSTSQLNWGLDGGAGLAISIGRLSAFVEGRVQNVYTQKGMADLKSIQSVPVSFGIMF